MAINPTIAQAILGMKGPDIVGQFELGREQARKEQARELTGKALAGEAEAIDKLRSVDPQVFMALQKHIGAQDEAGVVDFVRSAGIARRMLEAGDTAGALSFADNRLAILKAQGRDTSQTQYVRDLLARGDAPRALASLKAIDDSLAKASDLKTYAPVEYTTPSGERKLGIPEYDPKTRQVQFRDVPIGGEFVPKRETPGEIRTKERIKAEEKLKAERKGIEIAAEKKRREEQVKQGQELAKKAYEQLPGIRKSISNIDRAIIAIDKGAETGFIDQYLPSITEASIELDNLRGQMGLDVIGGTTFGALSEAELKFALDTALPTSMQPEDLKDWLQRKREAQESVRKEIVRVAKHFSKGGTIDELLERKEAPKKTPEQETAKPSVGQIKILSVK